MPQNTMETRLDALAAEVEQLKNHLTRIEMRLGAAALPPLISHAGSRQLPPSSATQMATAEENTPAEELWSWLSKASLLPRIATISFALVIALLLRTLTDSNVIAQQTGSYIGLGYATLLLTLSWWLLKRQSLLATIFSICGAMLMFLIVLEAHARFGALSSGSAYIILLATLIALVALGSRYHVPFLATIGLVVGGITAFAIDFPNPAFPLLASFLLLANWVAYMVSNRSPYNETARWGLFLLTAVLWGNWMIKLPSSNLFGPSLGGSWFLPFVLLYLVTFSAMTVHRTFGLGRLSFLDFLLPTMSGLLFYLAARAAVEPWLGQPAWAGAAGLGWSALLFLVSILAVYKSRESGKAACVFTFAGSALLLLTVPDITASILLSLPVWGVGALFLVRLSSHCEIGGIRLASYLLQVTACVAAIASGSFGIGTPHLPLSLAVAGGLTILSGFHYRSSRRSPINCSSGFFAKIDPKDKTAVVLLLVTMANGFATLQLGAALALAGTGVDLAMTITGLQSAFLNGGAFLLMVLGLRWQNREMLAVALAVFIGGAGKVFAYDLFVTHGVPLMVSVFSFGAAAALGSMVLGRWPQPSKKQQ
jgi:hypothetical protein